MVALYYKDILLHQAHGMRYKRLSFSLVANVVSLEWIREVIQKLFRRYIRRKAAEMATTLIQIKGIQKDIADDPKTLQGVDLTKSIEVLDDLVDNYGWLQGLFNSVDIESSFSRFPELKEMIQVLDEVVESLYAVNRSFKRFNLKTSISTTDAAKEAAAISNHSIQKIIYGN